MGYVTKDIKGYKYSTVAEQDAAHELVDEYFAEPDRVTKDFCTKGTSFDNGTEDFYFIYWYTALTLALGEPEDLTVTVPE